ncbi:Mog1p/PsbP-like protein [Dioscorea alata]|uniref:Mog1p/PsbP-like protein n=1 Tax=Dioscorea alata TaxID=55571 RepID=A0ACB7VU83_DIOAL|nr:Mog1p/PsbP-like protein [Dioscorea alata]
MATLPSWVSTLHNKFLNSTSRCVIKPVSTIKACSNEVPLNDNYEILSSVCSKRRALLVGASVLTSSMFNSSFTFAEEVPEKYRAFVDFVDGYSYYYPAEWRDFDFRGHDSAFKDPFAALQHVRVAFIPTEKKDIRDLGPMEEAIFDLVKNIYAAPNQVPTIYEMQEHTIDGKNYWTFEYNLESEAFARTAFATIAIGNGRYYTLVVGANERRWSRLRNKLKVVADSFRMIDI